MFQFKVWRFCLAGHPSSGVSRESAVKWYADVNSMKEGRRIFSQLLRRARKGHLQINPTLQTNLNPINFSKDRCFCWPGPELIFVTNITNYICGEKSVIKICHVEKFQISVKNLNNLWSFIEIYAVFVLNLCGEKSVWRKSLWRKNDKYEVWLELLMSFTGWWCWWLMAQFVGGFFLFMVVLDNTIFTSTSLARFRWFAVVASNIVVRTSRVWLM